MKKCVFIILFIFSCEENIPQAQPEANQELVGKYFNRFYLRDGSFDYFHFFRKYFTISPAEMQGIFY